MIRRWWDTLRVLVGRGRFEREMDEELKSHLAMVADELVARGVPRAEAERRARAGFGAVEAFKQEARAARGVHWIDCLRADVRQALRGLARAPGYTAVALATLALGIGGTTLMFSLIDGLLFRPLPFREPDRLVNLFLMAREAANEPAQPFAWSYPKFAAAREQATSFDGMAAFAAGNANLGGDDPERLSVEYVSGDYFRILGLGAAVGRLLTRADDSIPGGHPVVVLGQPFWRRRFGGDTTVIGRTVPIGKASYTVIGVAAPGFAGLTGGADVFLPMMMTPLLEYDGILTEGLNHWHGAIARLADGVTLARAQAEMAAIGRRVDERFRTAEQAAAWSATAEPLAAIRVDPAIARASWILFAATGVVLLIGAINLANLLLIRAGGRRRELAVRSAVGAGRGDLVRHLLVEGFLLALAGGTLGVTLAAVGGPWLAALGPRSPGGGPGGTVFLFDASAVAVDGRVLLFALGASLLTGLCTGLWPAWRAARTSGTGLLHDVRVAGQRTGRFGAAQLLVLAEAALAVSLVTGAFLLVRSLRKLTDVDLGFRGDQVITFRVSPGTIGVAGEDAPRFRAEALEKIRAIPGVAAAGTNLCLPLQGRCSSSVVLAVDGRRLAETEPREIGIHVVAPGYFESLRIPIIAGRAFDDRDRVGAPKGVLINETAAKRLWPGVNPVGRTIRVATFYFGGGDSSVAVIGVVGDVRYAGAGQPAGVDLYVPALQARVAAATFVIRTTGDPLAVVEPARRAIRQVDPGLPIFSVRTMEEVARAATARNRFATTLMGLFSAMALLLAAIGVYGVLAYSVAARSREIGIRLALGAPRGGVVRLVLRQGMTPIVLGLAVGLAAAALSARVLGGLLVGVAPTDPASYLSSAAALVGAGLMASYLPARRAARVDPSVTLREE